MPPRCRPVVVIHTQLGEGQDNIWGDFTNLLLGLRRYLSTKRSNSSTYDPMLHDFKIFQDLKCIGRYTVTNVSQTNVADDR